MRESQHNDISALKDIWENTFLYSRQFTDWYFENAFEPRSTFVFEDNSNPYACTIIRPQTISLNSRPFTAAYIAGTAVLPENRDADTMRTMLCELTEEIVRRDYPISLLVPSNYKFYERFGFRTAYSYKQYRITADDIPAYSIKCHVERCKNQPSEFEKLDIVYRQSMWGKNAFAMRKQQDWKMIIDDLLMNFRGKCALFTNENNEPTGYIMYIVKSGVMSVYEFAYTDRRAYESIFAYIKAHGMQAQEISIKAPVDDLSYLDFCDNRTAASICPFVMARINNAQTVLSFSAQDKELHLTLQIVDRLIPDNNATFSINAGEVEKTDAAPDVITDIGTLTQLFLGYLSIADAQKLNLLGGTPEKLSGLFEKRQNYINMLCF